MCNHHWVIDSGNNGECKICGVSRNFRGDNKRAFPEDYETGFSGGNEMRKEFKAKGEYYMQGSMESQKCRKIDYAFSVDKIGCL